MIMNRRRRNEDVVMDGGMSEYMSEYMSEW